MRNVSCIIFVFVDSAAVGCIGGMYEKLGRMVGRSYEETINLLIKSLKNAEVRAYCYMTSRRLDISVDSVSP